MVKAEVPFIEFGLPVGGWALMIEAMTEPIDVNVCSEVENGGTTSVDPSGGLCKAGP
jgi:hypothetical protein